MARPTGRRVTAADQADQHARAGPERIITKLEDQDAYTLEEFCRRHRFSIQFYYKLKGQGLTPDETRLGARVLITKESAAKWRAERTADTLTTTTDPP